MKSIALMGLGTMGSGMARRLIGAGFPVIVWNRTRESAEGFPSVAATPREAAAQVDVVTLKTSGARCASRGTRTHS
jgi:3-hydroxyisobutyrate dehydrogenase